MKKYITLTCHPGKPAARPLRKYAVTFTHETAAGYYVERTEPYWSAGRKGSAENLRDALEIVAWFGAPRNAEILDIRKVREY